MALEMSTVCRFSLISENYFLHKCQQGVGRWLITCKILSTLFVNAPLGFPDCKLVSKVLALAIVLALDPPSA